MQFEALGLTIEGLEITFARLAREQPLLFQPFAGFTYYKHLQTCLSNLK